MCTFLESLVEAVLSGSGKPRLYALDGPCVTRGSTLQHTKPDKHSSVRSDRLACDRSISALSNAAVVFSRVI